MFDSDLTEEQRLLGDAAREFCEKRVTPYAEEFDAAESLPADLLAELAELGYMGLLVPEAYGGMECDPVAYGLVIEQFARACAGLSITVSVHNSLVIGAVVNFGTEEQKAKWLPRLAAGEIGAYALTEPDAGSDAGSLKLAARADGDDYILNGSKIFVSSAIYAKLFVVFVSTTPEAGPRGITALVVEPDTPGFEIGKAERKLGIKSSDTRALFFTDVRVPQADHLGETDQGFKIALAQLDHGRMGVAVQGLGIGEAAFEAARDYAKGRHQFGRPIAEFQAVAFKLADMRLKLDASRLLIARAFAQMAAGENFTTAAAEAKLFASETANWVANEAVQIHGGYGYMKEYPVERYFRDARVTEIYEGTSEVLRIVISRAVLADD